MWKSILRFLKHNKVIFETIFATLLAIMVIIVSLAQFQATQEQSKLMEAQLSVAKQVDSPHISIHQYFQSDGGENLNASDLFQVINYGSEAYDVGISSAVYAEISVVGVNFSKTAQIPIVDYYNLEAYPENTTGLLYSARENYNYLEILRISDELKIIAEEFERHALLEVKRYIACGFTDNFGERHIEYFEISSNTTSNLDFFEGEEIFTNYEESYSKGKFLLSGDITAEELFALANE